MQITIKTGQNTKIHKLFNLMNRRTRTCNPPSSEIKSPDGKLRRYCRDVKRGKTTCSKYVRVPKISYKNLPRAILCQVGVEIWLKFTVPPPSSLGEPRRYCFLWIIDFFFQLLKKHPALDQGEGVDDGRHRRRFHATLAHTTRDSPQTEMLPSAGFCLDVCLVVVVVLFGAYLYLCTFMPLLLPHFWVLFSNVPPSPKPACSCGV